jgi:hypothetical protein
VSNPENKDPHRQCEWVQGSFLGFMFYYRVLMGDEAAARALDGVSA